MEMINLGASFHKKVFGMRCDKRPGIDYLTHTHFTGLQMQPFSFENKQGDILRGGIYFYENYDKKPLIVFFHGMGGGYFAYMAEIAFLCKGGYRVLAYDYRGTFSSDGDSLGGFCQSLVDADQILTHIKETFSEEEIYIVGHSWGGYTAGCMVNLHPDVKKAVLMAPPLSMSQAYHMLAPVKMIAEGMIAIEKEQYPQYWDQTILQNFSKESKTAVMIIHSKDDKMVHYEKTTALLQQNENYENVQFVIVDNKNHNPNYSEEAIAYKNAYFQKLGKAKNDKEREALEKTAQWHKMCEQDRVVMDGVLAFLGD